MAITRHKYWNSTSLLSHLNEPLLTLTESWLTIPSRLPDPYLMENLVPFFTYVEDLELSYLWWISAQITISTPINANNIHTSTLSNTWVSLLSWQTLCPDMCWQTLCPDMCWQTLCPDMCWQTLCPDRHCVQTCPDRHCVQTCPKRHYVLTCPDRHYVQTCPDRLSCALTYCRQCPAESNVWREPTSWRSQCRTRLETAVVECRYQSDRSTAPKHTIISP